MRRKDKEIKVKRILYGVIVGIIVPSMIFKFDTYIFVGAAVGGILALIIRNFDIK